VGQRYLLGMGCQPDSIEARKWLEIAAIANDAEACASLGWIYQLGKGIPVDPAKAFSYYSKAALFGSAAGKFNLALAYEQGIGTSVDYQKAREVLENASRDGHADATAELGRLYSAGQGVSKDPTSAFRLVNQAANQGSAIAHYYVAWAYWTGSGTPHNPKVAMEWFAKAKSMGVAEADGVLKIAARTAGLIKSLDQLFREFAQKKDPTGEDYFQLQKKLSSFDATGADEEVQKTLSAMTDHLAKVCSVMHEYERDVSQLRDMANASGHMGRAIGATTEHPQEGADILGSMFAATGALAAEQTQKELLEKYAKRLEPLVNDFKSAAITFQKAARDASNRYAIEN
jgi:hypothetical protein